MLFIYKIETTHITIFLFNKMRVFVFSPAYSTPFPAADQFSLFISQFGANLVGYNVTDMIYFMVGFDHENETYCAWSKLKDEDIPIKIADANWCMYS